MQITHTGNLAGLFCTFSSNS